MTTSIIVKFLNDQIPGLQLDERFIDGYFYMSMAATNCSYSVNMRSHQAHIAITGDKMNFFPLVTSYDYIKAREPKFKRKVFFLVPFIVNKKNLETKSMDIYNEYSNYTANLTDNMTLKYNRDYYKEKNAIIKKIHNDFVRVKAEAAFQWRGSDQYQLEIGHSKDPGEMRLFRELLLPEDILVVLKRDQRAEYFAFILSKRIKDDLKFKVISDIQQPSSDHNCVLTYDEGYLKDYVSFILEVNQSYVIGGVYQVELEGSSHHIYPDSNILLVSDNKVYSIGKVFSAETKKVENAHFTRVVFKVCKKLKPAMKLSKLQQR